MGAGCTLVTACGFEAPLGFAYLNETSLLDSTLDAVAGTLVYSLC